MVCTFQIEDAFALNFNFQVFSKKLYKNGDFRFENFWVKGLEKIVNSTGLVAFVEKTFFFTYGRNKNNMNVLSPLIFFDEGCGFKTVQAWHLNIEQYHSKIMYKCRRNG